MSGYKFIDFRAILHADLNFEKSLKNVGKNVSGNCHIN